MTQEWRFDEFPGPNGEPDVVAFLNRPARQGSGEASVTLRNNKSAGLIFLEPGSLGGAMTPEWFFAEFPAPSGEAAVVNFLNLPARQGPGEATATLRNDGSAGLVYLAPGSLGSTIDRGWHSIDFAPPNAEQAAVNYLNLAARQGPGEVSVTPRNDGSVSLVFLAPGSLGNAANPSWNFRDFPAPNGEAAAIDFLNNLAHRPGPGEATGFLRNNGTATVFYLQ